MSVFIYPDLLLNISYTIRLGQRKVRELHYSNAIKDISVDTTRMQKHKTSGTVAIYSGLYKINISLSYDAHNSTHIHKTAEVILMKLCDLATSKCIQWRSGV